MHALNDQITYLEISTNKLQRQIEQNNVSSKAQKKNNEALIAHSINSQFVKDGLSAVEQVNYLINEQVNPKLKEINEKHELILQLNTLLCLIRNIINIIIIKNV